MSTRVRGRTERVVSYLRAHSFGSAGEGAPLRFGAELELIALDAATRRVAAIHSRDGHGTLDVARDVAARLCWTERGSDKGAPRFVASHGGALTFEPGGQLEYASATHHTIDGVIAELAAVERALEEHAAERGIVLLAVGVDPDNGPDDAPLQLHADRYRRMAEYFAAIGPDGARMMRQTASLQLCIGGVDLGARWRVANALAPWLVAMFANSARYAGEVTGCASYRAETWRGVDHRRTGLFEGCDPLREYAAFALGAPAFLVGAEGAPPLAFGALIEDDASDTALATHLTTLFPEVRPRGYLELRSIDSVDATHRAAAMVFAAGILCDDAASAAAIELVGEPSPSLLRAAGRSGLADRALARPAADLVEIALAGCARRGETMVSESLIEAAGSALVDRLRGATARSPAVVDRDALTLA
jgi:glutamate--cysteine ligase